MYYHRLREIIQALPGTATILDGKKHTASTETSQASALAPTCPHVN